MNKGFLRFLPGLLFIITGTMAIVQERDYWEAASWFCFAIMVLIGVGRGLNFQGSKKMHMIAYFFGGMGLILLILRLLNILPEPVRPLP